MTVQLTKLPLYHKINKIDMLYFAKPELRGFVYSAKGRIISNMLYM
jgi:hypothetical protein